MLNFYGLDFSYYDHPNSYSLILYTSGCNLRCYGCHNRNLAGWDYSPQDSKKTVDVESCYKKLSKQEVDMSINNNLIDFVVLCWWEVLINPLNDVVETIDYIKTINPSVKVRIDTNWTFPQKVKSLIDMSKVDGFAIDIKWPYWDESFCGEISQVIWLSKQQTEKMGRLMTESLHYAKELPETIFRTVKYPIINDDSYFEEIKRYVRENLKKSHFVNEFVSL